MNVKAKPVRKAILIGSPGEKPNYLYSVRTDVNNIRKFLLSPRGGRWGNNEITILENPGALELIEILENTVADYQFIYFAGHGFETHLNERKICLKDYDFTDLHLLNQCPRQLIVLDCCRKKEYPAISGVPEEETWIPFDGFYPEREAFDNYILHSPPGKIMIHATKSGHYAWENILGKGGAFTTSLLLSARSVQPNEAYTPISIERILENAKGVIKQFGYQQEPEIVHSEGCMVVPFSLSLKKAPKPIKIASGNLFRQRTIQQDTGSSGLIAASLLLFAIAIVAE